MVKVRMKIHVPDISNIADKITDVYNLNGKEYKYISLEIDSGKTVGEFKQKICDEINLPASRDDGGAALRKEDIIIIRKTIDRYYNTSLEELNDDISLEDDIRDDKTIIIYYRTKGQLIIIQRDRVTDGGYNRIKRKSNKSKSKNRKSKKSKSKKHISKKHRSKKRRSKTRRRK